MPKTNGTSALATQLEDQYGLWVIHSLELETAQHILNRLAAKYFIPNIELKHAAKISRSTLRYTHGTFYPNRFGRDAYIRVVKGLSTNVATLVHEFAHYLDYTRRGHSNHRQPFKRTHEEVLYLVLSGKAFKLEETICLDVVNWAKTHFPTIVNMWPKETDVAILSNLIWPRIKDYYPDNKLRTI